MLRPTVLGICVVGAAACGSDGDVPGRVTFNEHIAPIVFDNCAACHRPDQVAPFSVLSYESVKAHAAEIGRETEARRMPPWLPAPGEFQLEGERRLTDVQIETIQRWIKQGMAEGDPAALPPTPEFPDGWELGTPDLVVSPDEPYLLTPNGPDVYRNLVVKTDVPAPRYVQAIEFRTNGAPIHHAVVRLDRTQASRRRDGADGEVGFEGMSWTAADPDGQFLGWAPGRGPIRSPDGMAWRLDPGTDLVVEAHVIRGDTIEPIAPTLGLHFTDEAPSLHPITLRLGSKVIDVPPGKSDYLVTDSYVLPFAVSVLSVYPHAHYLGKQVQAIATLPDGSVKTLLHIPRWSFHWQQDYRFQTPVELPGGTRLTMRWTYDNSSDNPDNPNDPPIRVLAGPKSTDEMSELGLQVLASSPAEAARLLSDFSEKGIRENVEMAEHRLKLDPDNPEYRAFLGGSYVQAGRYGEAVPHLETAVRLGDRTAATQSDLGAAKMGLGRPADALPHFQRAAELAPDDEVLHYNVGTTLSALSRHAEAERAFERALSINPDYADAHVNLGVALLGRRRYDDAVTHFRRAADLQPSSPVMQSNLAGAYMAAGRNRDALAAAKRALELDPAFAPAQDTIRRLAAMGIR
jgi:Flp pilus assembly protein TadD